MSSMQATHLPETPYAPKHSGKSAVTAGIHRRRVTEAEVAHAIADWFAGAPWSLEDAQWDHRDRKTVHLRDQGDRLVLKGVVIATRHPATVPDPLPAQRLAHMSEARAVARVALRGDHVRLYPPRSAPAPAPALAA